MGIRSGRISNSQLTSSSIYNPVDGSAPDDKFAPYFGRLDFQGNSSAFAGWVADSESKSC